MHPKSPQISPNLPTYCSPNMAHLRLCKYTASPPSSSPSLGPNPGRSPKQSPGQAPREALRRRSVCLSGEYPALCKYKLLTRSELARVRNAECRVNLKTCLSGQYPSLCNKRILTAKHLALTNNAAPAVVEWLVTAYPEAAREKDGDGRLPLHIAFENEAAPAVVERLVAAYPAAARAKDGEIINGLLAVRWRKAVVICVCARVCGAGSAGG